VSDKTGLLLEFSPCGGVGWFSGHIQPSRRYLEYPATDGCSILVEEDHVVASDRYNGDSAWMLDNETVEDPTVRGFDGPLCDGQEPEVKAKRAVRDPES
jgi:hypothetical protein